MKRLTDREVQLCLQIVNRLFDGTARGYRAAEIPAWIHEEIGTAIPDARELGIRLHELKGDPPHGQDDED